MSEHEQEAEEKKETAFCNSGRLEKKSKEKDSE